ncbi:MAG: metallophosphoesterase family protein [Verrucomicrobiota bacterium]
MRYAFLSDIHGNRQALNAVFADIKCRDIDEVICLGDIVGYGPAPAEVLSTVYRQVNHIVLGNHDAVLAGHLTGDNFNDTARLMLDWTRRQLDDRATSFLNGLPYVIEGRGFRCVHSEPAAPGDFGYIYDETEAATAFDACQEQLIFVGHTHIPALFVTGNSGRTYIIDPCDFGLEDNKRYIVNVGSVGQSRDGDPRASYCIFDSESNSVFFQRIAFDTEAYRHDIEERDIPCPQTFFLETVDKNSLPPVREMVDFKPTASSSGGNDIPVKQLEEVYRRARIWRNIGLLTLILLVALTGFGGWMFLTMGGDEIYRIPAQSAPLNIRFPAVNEELVKEPQANADITLESPAMHWQIELENPNSQKLTVAPEEDDPEGINTFRINNTELHHFRLVSPPVKARKGTRYTAKAQFKNVDVDEGFAEVKVFQKTSGGDRLLMKSDASSLINRPDRWLPTSVTSREPFAADTELQYVISGQIKGVLRIRKCSFFRRE